jgi:UDP-N-acetylmuramate dehydrogenase
MKGEGLLLRDVEEYMDGRFRGTLEEKVPLAAYTTFRIGGPADILALPRGVEDLLLLAQAAVELQSNIVVLGRGSNTLVSDLGFRGIVAVLCGGLSRITQKGKDELYVEAGCDLGRLVNRCVEAGLGGLEDLAGIPGTVGGAVRVNAGAHGSSIGDRIVDVYLFRMEEGEVKERELPAWQVGFRYRETALSENEIIYKVGLKLYEEEIGKLEARRKQALQWRRENQPLGMPSAGSVFRNPEGEAAGALIDRCGLKGMKVGDAVVSEKHANFIVNTGGATAADVLELIRRVKEEVYRKAGVELREEIRIVGEKAEEG